MKWSEMVHIVDEKGWLFERHGKRHDIYRNPISGERLLIERHWNQEVKSKLYKKLKKQIGF